MFQICVCLCKHPANQNLICLYVSNTICIFLGPQDHELTASQIVIMKQAMNKVRETVQRLASDHRDLHSTVSKVGKAIDRVIIA